MVNSIFSSLFNLRQEIQQYHDFVSKQQCVMELFQYHFRQKKKKNKFKSMSKEKQMFFEPALIEVNVVAFFQKVHLRQIAGARRTQRRSNGKKIENLRNQFFFFFLC